MELEEGARRDRLGLRRAARPVTAWPINWLCISAWDGLTAAVGVQLYLAGILRPGGMLLLNVVAALIVVLSVVLAAAVLDPRRSGAAPGMRILRSKVIGPAGRQTFDSGGDGVLLVGQVH